MHICILKIHILWACALVNTEALRRCHVLYFKHHFKDIWVKFFPNKISTNFFGEKAVLAMRSQIWDLVPIGSLEGPKKVPILLASPKFHFSVFVDGYLLWKKMYFDLNLKYIWDKYTYYTLSSRYETLGFFALALLRETCVCSGHL